MLVKGATGATVQLYFYFVISFTKSISCLVTLTAVYGSIIFAMTCSQIKKFHDVYEQAAYIGTEYCFHMILFLL